MFTVVKASGAAMLFGSADFLSGVSSKGRSALVVTVVAQVVSLPFLLAGLFLISAAPTQNDLLWWLAASAANGLGLSVRFAGAGYAGHRIVFPTTPRLPPLGRCRSQPPVPGNESRNTPGSTSSFDAENRPFDSFLDEVDGGLLDRTQLSV